MQLTCFTGIAKLFLPFWLVRVTGCRYRFSRPRLKGFRDIEAAIIGHDTGHFYTEPLVPGDCGPEVDNSTERFFIGMDLAE